MTASALTRPHPESPNDMSRVQGVGGRCFVVDPVCAFEFGHSLNSLKYFAELARKRWPKTFAVASYHLPSHEGPDDGIERFFDFYFDKFLPIKRKPIPYNGSILPLTRNPMERALADFADFYFYKNLGYGDKLILNNADIYSTAALLCLCEGRRPESLPGVYLRFIGVMENASVTPDIDFLEVAEKLARLKQDGYRFAISAETPKLARKLAHLLDCRVWTTPYPISEEKPLPLPEESQFPVLCGGSARLDKGFERLPAIIEIVNRTHSETIRFVVQNLPAHQQANHLSTIANLYSTPNVDLLEGTLSFEEMMDSYRKTCLSIMPYDEAVYAERGSAILMESIMCGRLVVGQSNTAFSEQILLYNCGEVCRTNEDFARAIIRLSEVPRHFIRQQVDMSRSRYLADVESAYNGWLGAFA